MQNPKFLAALGIIEIKRWSKIKDERKNNLEKLIFFFKNSQINILSSYENKDRNYSFKRFVWLNEENLIKEKDIKEFIDITSFWFKNPL